MADIIDVLKAVYAGLNRLQVCGMDNAKTLAACGDGVAAAIRGLQAEARKSAEGKAKGAGTDG